MRRVYTLAERERMSRLSGQLTTRTQWAKVGADGAGQSDGNETKTFRFNPAKMSKNTSIAQSWFDGDEPKPF